MSLFRLINDPMRDKSKGYIVQVHGSNQDPVNFQVWDLGHNQTCGNGTVAFCLSVTGTLIKWNQKRKRKDEMTSF